jgi:hypothetical protein
MDGFIMSTQTSTSPPKAKSVTQKIIKQLPKQIRVVNVDVDVICDENIMAKANIKHGDGDEKAGLMIEAEQQILLDPALGPDLLADTLLHEIMHWIFYLNGGREFFGSKKEEQFVCLITSSLHSVLINNKELRDYLFPPEED